MAWDPPSDLPISCPSRSRATDLQRRSSGEDGYAHQHARKNARLSAQSPHTSAGRQGEEGRQRAGKGAIGGVGGGCSHGGGSLKRGKSGSLQVRRVGDARGLDPHSNELREARKKGGAVNPTCQKRLMRLK